MSGYTFWGNAPVIGMYGVPGQGRVFHVNPRVGSDGNKGRMLNHPVASVAKALSLMTTGQNDVAYLYAAGNTGSTTTDYLSAVVDWNLNCAHLIGVGSNVPFSSRSRIAQLSTATALSPLFTISGSSCQFKNISWFQGVNDATSPICVNITGHRNYFENCHFAGMGHDTIAQATTGRCLKITGGEENYFKNCVIGVDTVARTVANYSLEMASGAARNVFENCLFVAYATTLQTQRFLLVNAVGIDRFLYFNRCVFINQSKITSGLAMTAAFNINAAPGGIILVKDCTTVGVTDWELTGESGFTFIDGAAATNNTSGLAVNVETT